MERYVRLDPAELRKTPIDDRLRLVVSITDTVPSVLVKEGYYRGVLRELAGVISPEKGLVVGFRGIKSLTSHTEEIPFLSRGVPIGYKTSWSPHAPYGLRNFSIFADQDSRVGLLRHILKTTVNQDFLQAAQAALSQTESPDEHRVIQRSIWNTIERMQEERFAHFMQDYRRYPNLRMLYTAAVGVFCQKYEQELNEKSADEQEK